MPRISKGVQNFQRLTQSLKQEATSEHRNVTKKEVAVALYEMVKNDKLSQADKKAALTLLDAGIPLTRGAEDLIEGFASGDNSSFMNVMMRGEAAGENAEPLPTSGSSRPSAASRVYSSLDRLNEMVALFTDRGNMKLDTGEVQALAAFYGGLKPSSRGKIRDRMVEIYQTATYSGGQQDALRELLEYKGFSRAELEGVADTGTVSGFNGMSDAAKADQLAEIYSEHQDYSLQYSALRPLSGSDVTAAAMAKINAAVTDFVDSEQAALEANDAEDPSVWEGDTKLIYLVDDNGDPDLNSPIGVGAEVHQTFGNGGNTTGLYFGLDGTLLGDDLLAEE